MPAKLFVSQVAWCRKHYDSESTPNDKQPKHVTASCKLCSLKLSLTSGWGSTTKASLHLLREHQLEYTPERPAAVSAHPALSFTPKGSLYSETVLGVAHAACRHGIPNAFFSNKNVQRAFLPYTVSRYHIAKAKLHLAADSLSELGAALRQSANPGVTLAFDLGTVDKLHTLNAMIVSPFLNRSYMLKSKSLDSTTAADLAVILEECIEKFNSLNGGRIVALCCDNAANVLKSSKMVTAATVMMSFNCACHVLNLISQDVEATLDINETEIKRLQSENLLKRSNDTRWWSKYIVIGDFVAKNPNYFATNREVFDQMLSYLSIMKTLFFVGRSLERDCATLPLAIHFMLELMESPERLVREATMERFIKFYATSNAVLIYTMLSPYAAASFDGLGVEEASFFKRMFLKTANAIAASDLKAFADSKNPNVFVGAINDWTLGTGEGHTQLLNGGATLAAFDTSNSSALRVVKAVYRRVCCISATECSSERSYSIMKYIRSGRYNLSAKNTEVEVMVSFNPSRFEDGCSLVDDVVVIDSDEETEETDESKREEKRARVETSQVKVPTPEDAKCRAILEFDPRNVPFLSRSSCLLILRMRLYVSRVWNTMSKGDDVEFIGKPIHRGSEMKYTAPPATGGTGWVQVKLLATDRTRNVATLLISGKEFEWTLGNCFRNNLQFPGYSETYYSPAYH